MVGWEAGTDGVTDGSGAVGLVMLAAPAVRWRWYSSSMGGNRVTSSRTDLNHARV